MNLKKIILGISAATLVAVPVTAQAVSNISDLDLPATVQNALTSEQPITELAEPVGTVETNLWQETTLTNGTQKGYVISHGKYMLTDTEGETDQEIAVTEYQWADSDTAATAASCSHKNKKNVGTSDLYRSHGAQHPNYCTVYIYQDWRCDDCHQNGTTCTTTLVWCTSSKIIDSVDQPEQTEM